MTTYTPKPWHANDPAQPDRLDYTRLYEALSKREILTLHLALSLAAIPPHAYAPCRLVLDATKPVTDRDVLTLPRIVSQIVVALRPGVSLIVGESVEPFSERLITLAQNYVTHGLRRVVAGMLLAPNRFVGAEIRAEEVRRLEAIEAREAAQRIKRHVG